ncbi:hypothetical protein PNA2_1438 [Pyrococcus sp. NA2]|uniref:hypothetical protein n=1 Tax=Pyrococcus sp. (strain NA2) TaxID=342949 RepID=UPI000209AF2F|nr:hypothetical protein [Pyrococcus sp. NA2]AEC52353.1 hypothetical protein PNA2_1438 [Pyrococcus sp. NA2]
MKKLLAILVWVLIIGTVGLVNARPTNNEILPQDGGGYWELWKVESVEEIGSTYGEWTTLDETMGYAGQTYSFTTQVSWSHKVSGSLMVTYKMLSAALGFDVLESGTVQVTISGKFEHDGQKIAFQVRPKYMRHKVVQRKYIHIDGQNYPTNERRTLWVDEFLHYQHRAKPLN